MILRVAHITLYHFIVGGDKGSIIIVITILENLSGLLRLFSSFDFENLLNNVQDDASCCLDDVIQIVSCNSWYVAAIANKPQLLLPLHALLLNRGHRQ